MSVEIGEQRIEQIMRIAVAIEVDREFAGLAFNQFRRRVVLLKIDEHGLSVPSFRIAAKRQVRNPYSPVVVMGSGLRADLVIGPRDFARARWLGPRRDAQ